MFARWSMTCAKVLYKPFYKFTCATYTDKSLVRIHHNFAGRFTFETKLDLRNIKNTILNGNTHKGGILYFSACARAIVPDVMNMQSQTTRRLSDVKITSEDERAVAAQHAERKARAAQDAHEIQRLTVEAERRLLTLRAEGAFRRIAKMGGQRHLDASEQKVIAVFFARESPVMYLALEFDKPKRRYWGYVMNRHEGSVYGEFDHCELGYMEETSGHPMMRLPRQEYYQTPLVKMIGLIESADGILHPGNLKARANAKQTKRKGKPRSERNRSPDG